MEIEENRKDNRERYIVERITRMGRIKTEERKIIKKLRWEQNKYINKQYMNREASLLNIDRVIDYSKGRKKWIRSWMTW